ncbi:ABC transporter permease protein [Bacillus sp. TS-2]|nr:ABC transporter permease protein [Bacillus sp. TS-2]
MKNSWKVAKWEIKRNVKNKSFIISILSTPLLFILFFSIPMLFSGDSSDENNPLTIYIHDELEIWEEIENGIDDLESLNWEVDHQIVHEDVMLSDLENMESSIYFSLTEETLMNGQIQIYLSNDLDENDVISLYAIEPILKSIQLEYLGFDEQEAMLATNPITFQHESPSEASETSESSNEGMAFLERLVPGLFAAVILFSVVISGMMIFTSASQEKKEKVSEMILSSISPTELMQGKIIGYFFIGIIQVIGWIAIILPFLVWYVTFPILQYLFVPELLVLILIAVLGYLLFASIFVGIGATVDEMSSTSNFQGMVMMLPWIPFILIGPVIADPSGIIAQVGSFVPITAPGVWLIRLSILETWPWVEIIISLLILAISIWITMKMAGKVFKTGILLYGKNATPAEIIKWLKQ